MYDLYLYGTWLTVIFWGIWLVSGQGSAPHHVMEQASRLERFFDVLSLAAIVFAVFTSILVFPPALGGWLLFNNVLITSLAGFICVIGGLSLALWARLYMSRYWRDDTWTRTGQRIVKHGPYRIVRHPLYVGILLDILGMFLLLPQLIDLVGFLLAMIAYVFRAWQEERFLLRHYYAEYQQYRKDTHCVLPWYHIGN